MLLGRPGRRAGRRLNLNGTSADQEPVDKELGRPGKGFAQSAWFAGLHGSRVGVVGVVGGVTGLGALERVREMLCWSDFPVFRFPEVCR